MLRIFTLKFQSTLGAFDDAELQAFIKDKEVVGANPLTPFPAREGGTVGWSFSVEIGGLGGR